jgi:hypothetical protein
MLFMVKKIFRDASGVEKCITRSSTSTPRKRQRAARQKRPQARFGNTGHIGKACADAELVELICLPRGIGKCTAETIEHDRSCHLRSDPIPHRDCRFDNRRALCKNAQKNLIRAARTGIGSHLRDEQIGNVRRGGKSRRGALREVARVDRSAEKSVRIDAIIPTNRPIAYAFNKTDANSPVIDDRRNKALE